MDKPNSSKIDLKIHPKEGLKMTITSSPWLRFCAGTAILLCAFSVVALAIVPLISALIS